MAGMDGEGVMDLLWYDCYLRFCISMRYLVACCLSRYPYCCDEVTFKGVEIRVLISAMVHVGLIATANSK